jgi:hypothetical protein
MRFTIDHTQVGGSDLADFPVVVTGTFPELRTVANGGRINNLGTFGDPADFVVSPNPDGSGKYDFQVREYDPATGTIEVWFRQPTLSASVDETFYFVYDDPAVTDFQGSDHFGSHPEWDANYQGVYHMAGGLSIDATGNFYHGTATGTTLVGGVVGSAVGFAGGTDVIDVPTFANYSGPMSFEFWAQMPATPPSTPFTLLRGNANSFLIYFRPLSVTIDLFTPVGEVGVPYPTDGSWHHYVLSVNGSGALTATIDGVAQTVTTLTAGPLTPSTSTSLKFGAGFENSLTGSLDEVRFSSIDRIASGAIGYAVASYNNQKPGSTFITVH